MPTVPELKAMAKARGIKGFSKMLKGELEAALAAAAPMAPGLQAALAAAAAMPGHGAYEEAYAPVARPAAAPAAAPKKDDRPFAKAPGVASAIDKLREVEAATKRRNTMRQVEALDKEITRLTALKGELEATLARPAAAPMAPEPPETPRERNIRQAMEQLAAAEGSGIGGMVFVNDILNGLRVYNDATPSQMRSAYELGADALKPLPTKKADAFLVKHEHAQAIPSLLIAAGMGIDDAISTARKLTQRFISDGEYNLGFKVHKTPKSLIISVVKPVGSPAKKAAAPAMREAVKDIVAGLSAEEKKALAGIKRQKMMSVEDALAAVLKANGYDPDSGEADYEFMSGSEDAFADAVIKDLTRMGMTRRQIAMSAAEMDEGYTMFDDLVKEFPEAYRIRKAMKGDF